MIDIHCHLLYGVDDGAKTIEESVAMLEAAKEQGISAMILTPHYRHGMFAYPKEEIEEHFRILEPYAQKLGIYLALGTEYHVNSHIVEALDSADAGQWPARGMCCVSIRTTVNMPIFTR